MRQKQVSPPLDPSDFVGSAVQQQLQRWDQLRPPAVHIPVWCVWITRTSTQAVVLAQLAYWFSPTRKMTNRNSGLPRSLYRVDFGSGQPRRCVASSYRELAQQCGLSRDQVRTAENDLVALGLVARVTARDGLRGLVDAEEDRQPLLQSGAPCLRLQPGGIDRVLVQCLLALGWLQPHDGRPLEEWTEGPSWGEVQRSMLREVALHNRTQRRPLPADAPRESRGLAYLRHGDRPDGEDFPHDHVPDDDELLESTLHQLLASLQLWVTLPQWVIQLVGGQLNEALVMARILQWQDKLRKRHADHLWLEKTHEQLARERGMLTPRASRTASKKVRRALDALARWGLIEKQAPPSPCGNRFSRIRLLPMQSLIQVF